MKAVKAAEAEVKTGLKRKLAQFQGAVRDEMADALLSAPLQDQTHCSDKEIAEYAIKFKTVLTVFD